MSEVVKADLVSETEESGGALTPLEMLDRAVSAGANPATLERLMSLHDKWEAKNARKAYRAAMAKAKAEFLPIYKNTSGYANRYKYEELADVTNAVDASLAKHGFSYDWETDELDDGRVRVTCVMSHEDGHEKRNSLSGHPEKTADAKANMNDFQRLGGAVTYLQRYTLKSALGLAAAADTDASSHQSPTDWKSCDRVMAVKNAATEERLLELRAQYLEERNKKRTIGDDEWTAILQAFQEKK